METVELSPDDAAELTALYETYDWWADRDDESVREGLVPFYERCGFESYPSPVERPDGPAEEMAHLYRPREEEGEGGSDD